MQRNALLLQLLKEKFKDVYTLWANVSEKLYKFLSLRGGVSFDS